MNKEVIRHKLYIPPDLNFSDLKLARDGEDLTFEPEPINRIGKENGMDIQEIFKTNPQIIAEIIKAWYQHHLAEGGEPDPIQEDLMAEKRLADKQSIRFSN